MLSPWKECYSNLDSVLKSTDITLLSKVYKSKLFFPVVTYRCENWTIMKAEHRTNAFELVMDKTLESLRDCTSKPMNSKGNQSEYSLEGLMLKLKLQYFGHLMQRANSLENTLTQRKIHDSRRGG